MSSGGRQVAGTAKQYSTKAKPQETRIAFYTGQACPCLRCPYQANVMKTLEQNSSRIVGMVEWARRKRSDDTGPDKS